MALTVFIRKQQRWKKEAQYLTQKFGGKRLQSKPKENKKKKYVEINNKNALN